ILVILAVLIFLVLGFLLFVCFSCCLLLDVLLLLDRFIEAGLSFLECGQLIGWRAESAGDFLQFARRLPLKTVSFFPLLLAAFGVALGVEFGSGEMHVLQQFG